MQGNPRKSLKAQQFRDKIFKNNELGRSFWQPDGWRRRGEIRTTENEHDLNTGRSTYEDG